MNKVFTELKKFRDDRGLDKSFGNIVANLLEEIRELVVAIENKDDHEIVDALCDCSVFSLNALTVIEDTATPTLAQYNTNNECIAHELLATVQMLLEIKNDPIVLLHIVELCTNEVTRMGYNFEKAMLETCKEINSREGEHDPKIGKWVKFKTPEAMNKWYKADYTTCKIS